MEPVVGRKRRRRRLVQRCVTVRRRRRRRRSVLDGQSARRVDGERVLGRHARPRADMPLRRPATADDRVTTKRPRLDDVRRQRHQRDDDDEQHADGHQQTVLTTPRRL